MLILLTNVITAHVEIKITEIRNTAILSDRFELINVLESYSFSPDGVSVEEIGLQLCNQHKYTKVKSVISVGKNDPYKTISLKIQKKNIF